MKRTLPLLLLLLCLFSCKPITKFPLPFSGEPPLVTYAETVPTSTDKQINYDNVLKKIRELVPDGKLNVDDKNHCYFQMIGYTMYPYKGKERKCAYVLNFQGGNNECSIKIHHLTIRGNKIERVYKDNKRKALKAFNPAYEGIHNNLTALMAELKNQLK